MHKVKSGFTLIEVMVAIMIISVVVMAMIEMHANNTHLFSVFQEKSKVMQYASFVVANNKIGLENKKTTLYDFVDEFELEDDLRRKLKKVEVNVLYQELETIDLSSFDDAPKEDDTQKDEGAASNLVFYVGKTILQFPNSSLALMRLSVQ